MQHPDDATFEGLLIVRPEGRIFFANVESVTEQIRALLARHQPRVLALDMSRVPDIEYSALRLLLDLDRRALALGIDWWLVALNPEVLEVVTRCGLAERLGRERMLFNARTAIERFVAQEHTDERAQEARKVPHLPAAGDDVEIELPQRKIGRYTLKRSPPKYVPERF